MLGSSPAASTAPRVLVRVWDRPVRVLHAMLIGCVPAAWITGDVRGPWHERLGYAILAIVVARLAWGFVGNRHARFRDWLRGPACTSAYLRAVLARRAPRHLGHNPLGGWMIVALLGCLGALSLTGMLYETDLFWGLSWLVSLHVALGWLLLVLVLLHVLGVGLMSRYQRENLVAAMITGRKRAPAVRGGGAPDARAPRFGPR
ncbi:MAG: cytochrome b/b6 domain-containing protein [Lautropia sp.]